MARRASCWMCRACMRWAGAQGSVWRRKSARPTRQQKRSSKRSCLASALAVPDENENTEAQQRDGAADPYVGSRVPADVDLRAARRDGNGEQAVVSSRMLADDRSIVADSPGGIVHEAEDRITGGRSIQHNGAMFR